MFSLHFRKLQPPALLMTLHTLVITNPGPVTPPHQDSPAPDTTGHTARTARTASPERRR